MGSDDRFRKMKARRASSLVRKTGKRESYDVVLIVCEGEKTEPNYLKGLKRALDLGNANVKVLEDGHRNDPVGIVQCAIDSYEEESLYDRIYCVFDRDGHARYSEAIDLATHHHLASEGKLFAITSVPCFEVWLLLHFEYTTQGFVKSGNRSACDQIVRALKDNNHIKSYVKNYPNIFDLLNDRTDTAIKHAKRLTRYNAQTASDNPSTKMHELVEYLRGLKK